MMSKSLSRNKIQIIGILTVVVLAAISLYVGKFPLEISELLAGNELHWKVFVNLRLSRTLVGLWGGFALGVTGFVYQTLFRNPLAAPDIIGVSSGASAGAAAGILFCSGFSADVLLLQITGVTFFSFVGALTAVVLALILSRLASSNSKSTIILAGIAVHSLAQTVLMVLKMVADPEKELASIEYWIMGSLNSVRMQVMAGNMVLCVICIVVIFMLHRQLLLLAADEVEARMMGVNVERLRLILLVLATLTVASVVSIAGLVSFVGLFAPHAARMITKNNRIETMFLAGIVGSCLLIIADILARSIAATELPISIFTSLIGAPFLIYLVVKGKADI